MRKILTVIAVSVALLSVGGLVVQRGSWCDSSQESKHCLKEADEAIAVHDYQRAEQLLQRIEKFAVQAPSTTADTIDVLHESEEKLWDLYERDNKPEQAEATLTRLLSAYSTEAETLKMSAEKDHSEHEMVSTLNRLATLLQNHGKTAEAIDLYKEYLPKIEKNMAGTALQSEVENRYTSLLKSCGRYDEASKAKLEFDSSHCSLLEAKTLLKEAVPLLMHHQWKEAETNLQIAVNASARLHNQGLTADAIHWQAYSKFWQGDNIEAQALFLKSLALAKQISDRETLASSTTGLALNMFWDGHPDKAKILCTAARTMDAKEIAAAIRLTDLCFNGDDKDFNDVHDKIRMKIASFIELLWTPEFGMQNPEESQQLALICCWRGKLRLAEKITETSILSLQKHPRKGVPLFPVFINLSDIRSILHDGPGTLKALDAATAAATDSSSRGTALMQQGKCYAISKDFARSSKCFEQAIIETSKASGENSIPLANGLSALSADEIALEHIDKAATHCQQALRIRRSIAPKSLEYGMNLAQMATILALQKKPAESLNVMNEAIQIYELNHRSGAELAVLASQQAATERELGHYKESAAFIDKAALELRGQEQKFPECYIGLIKRRALLALSEKRYEDCQKFDNEVIADVAKTYGTSSPEYAFNLREIAGHYSSQGLKERAAALSKQAAAISRQN